MESLAEIEDGYRMIGVPLRAEFKRGAEKGNDIVNISLHALGETMENDMGKVGECCGSLRMPIGTPVKHFLKTLEGNIQVIAIVALPVESICLMRCISYGIDLTGLKRRKLAMITKFYVDILPG